MLVVSRRSAPAAGQRGDRLPARAASTPGSGGGPSPSASCSHAHAIRHGWRTACSPPGSRTGHSAPARSKPRRSPTRSSPPHTVPSGPSPVPSKIAPTAGPGHAVLGQARGQMRVVVLHADVLGVLALERVLRRQVVRVQVVRDQLGLDGEHPLEVRDPLARRAAASRGSPGRRCGGETHARAPLATQNVLFSSAPHASIGRAAALGSVMRGGHVAARAAQHQRPARGRRARPSRRCACGSPGRAAGTRRRCRASRASASSSSYAIGSSETLPLVITSGTPTSASSRWCSGVYGSITPSSRAARRDRRRDAARRARRGASTIGRARERSSASSRSELDQPSRGRDVGDHQRERLVLAVLARAQRRDRRARRRRRRPGGSRRAP